MTINAHWLRARQRRTSATILAESMKNLQVVWSSIPTQDNLPLSCLTSLRA